MFTVKAFSLFLSVSFPASQFAGSHQKADWHYKGFLIINLNLWVFGCHYLGLYPPSFSLCFLSSSICAQSLILLRHLTFAPPCPRISPVHKDQRRSPLTSPKPPRFPLCCLPPSLFLPFSLSKLQWQIEVRLSTAGCFNFIDPLQRWQKLRIVSACD